MSEMQELIKETTSKLMQRYSSKEVINDTENGQWASDLWNFLNEYGMLTVAIPEELGGNGGDYSDALSILRLAGKYSAPIPIAETYLANWLLSGLGVPVSTEIITIAFEKDWKSFQFVKNGTGWVVTGKARNVPFARFAEKFFILGETSDGPILSLIPLKGAKIVYGQNLAGEARDEVIFDNVYIDDCKVIPICHNEMNNKILYGGALTRIVMMSGALENILEITVNYASERSQFGRPINRFQAVQHHLAQLAGETAAATVAANCAGDSYDIEGFSQEIAMAKIRVNEASGRVCQLAHQVLAAIGFTYEHTLHHSTRRLWSWRDEYGTESDWENVLTEELVTLQENGLWSMITGVNHEKRVQI
ncbi:acyl-CoA dehydrogenase family protein [Neobacillus niacini]|uniref:acyl-CoA dehydrogenase family protein n=1 Tax=Neobacillus niacini TaxID=86668 RepID=UPI003B02807E